MHIGRSNLIINEYTVYFSSLKKTLDHFYFMAKTITGDTADMTTVTDNLHKECCMQAW